MSIIDRPEVAVPDTGALAFGDEPSFRRILVPVRLAGEAAGTLAVAARVPDRVMRKANCPVLAVHPQPKAA